jgi:hypothetical protein
MPHPFHNAQLAPRNKVSAFCGSVIADQVVLWPGCALAMYIFAECMGLPLTCISLDPEAGLTLLCS